MATNWTGNWTVRKRTEHGQQLQTTIWMWVSLVYQEITLAIPSSLSVHHFARLRTLWFYEITVTSSYNTDIFTQLRSLEILELKLQGLSLLAWMPLYEENKLRWSLTFTSALPTWRAVVVDRTKTNKFLCGIVERDSLKYSHFLAIKPMRTTLCKFTRRIILVW